MNWDRIQSNWKQFTGQAKEHWSQLTNDDFHVVTGRRDQLAGKIQEHYGLAIDSAENQIAKWEHKATNARFQKK